MKNMKLFIILLSFTAFVIAGTAAYFSVFGLSKLFAGAGISALILFGTLEFGKIVSVSVLYRYWKYFNWFIRFIFTFMIIGIMTITSMGIYGFLRNAYDKTSNQFSNVVKQTKILDQKKNAYNIEISRYQTEIDSKNKQIDTYLDNRATQEQLVSNLYNKSADTTLSSGQSWIYRKRAKETQDNIKEYNKQISELRNKNNELYLKINSLNDSITKIDNQILELESSDIAVEIGPLKYLSDLTGQPMDNVVGGLIFLIMFVFDPFAILLIIVSNRLSLVLEEKNNKKTLNNEKEILKEKENLEEKTSNNEKEILKEKENLEEKISNNNEDIDFDDIKNNFSKLNNLNDNLNELKNSLLMLEKNSTNIDNKYNIDDQQIEDKQDNIEKNEDQQITETKIEQDDNIEEIKNQQITFDKTNIDQDKIIDNQLINGVVVNADKKEKHNKPIINSHRHNIRIIEE